MCGRIHAFPVYNMYTMYYNNIKTRAVSNYTLIKLCTRTSTTFIVSVKPMLLHVAQVIPVRRTRNALETILRIIVDFN